MLIALTIFFLKTAVATSEAQENIIEELARYTDDFRSQVKPTLLSDIFIRFQDKYDLFEQEINSLTQLSEKVREKESGIESKDIEQLYSYYIKHIEYIKQVEARNKLIYYVKNNPKSTCLDRSSLLKEFYDTHKLTNENSKTFDDFKTFMRNIDYRIDISVIRIIYSHVYEYQQYLSRKPSLENLKTQVADRTKKTNDLEVSMKDFTKDYKMTGKDVSKLRTFRQLFYAVDFSASDSVTRNLHPYIRKYSSAKEIQEKRQKLLSKIGGSTSVKSHEIQLEARQFLSVCKLLDTDITNIEIFKNEIIRKDDTISRDSEELNILHLHVIKYVEYAYKIEVRKMLLNLISKNADLSIFEISIVMESFIASYNLFDAESITDGRKLKEQMFTQDGVTTDQEANAIYPHYEKYIQYLDLELAKDCVLSLMHNYPREKISRFESSMDRMLRGYRIYQYGVSRVENFAAYMREMNPLISDHEAKTLHPKVLQFLEYRRKKSVYDELSSCIRSSDVVKPNLGDLSKRAIDILSLKKPHLTDYEKFKEVVKEIYVEPNNEEMKMVFDQLVLYQTSILQPSHTVELAPGEINIDGSIVPPSSGTQLTWYNFFKAFGASSHIVQDVSTFEELSAFQKWFDNFYYERTGIHYYIIEPFLALGLPPISQTFHIPPVITNARVASQS